MVLNLGNIYRNLPGWRTKRKIVVFESDDWGSIRMTNSHDRRMLISGGLNFDRNPFFMLDTLESNQDLEVLFEILSKHSDKNGRKPVFTAAVVVANPDFDKISENQNQNYYYEPYNETCKKYPGRDRVHDLRLVGLREGLFKPVFHGREHLNVKRWMDLIRQGDKAVLTTLKYRTIGISEDYSGKRIKEHLAAFVPESRSDLPFLKEILDSGTQLYKTLFGQNAEYFVPPNSPGSPDLENDLLNCGMKYINTGRFIKEQYGDGVTKLKFHWLGQRNMHDQIYLIRNCFFEPFQNKNRYEEYINRCLKEIEMAFFFNKPAIVSTHRINYVGGIESTNRDHGIFALDRLISRMLNKWPEIEFMTSVELGKQIRNVK